MENRRDKEDTKKVNQPSCVPIKFYLCTLKKKTRKKSESENLVTQHVV